MAEVSVRQVVSGGGALKLHPSHYRLKHPQGFDWAGLEEGSLVVDVGGGIGSTSMTLAKAFPHLRFCIQDRPKTVELGMTVRQPPCRAPGCSLTSINPGVERAVS